MNTTTYGPVVPEGQSPPLAVVTPTDHAAWILLSTTIGLSITLIFAGIRIFVRTTISRPFAIDDHTLLAGTFLAVVQAVIIFVACDRGLGKSLEVAPIETQDQVQALLYTSNLFFILCLGLSKCSVICFLRRLSRDRNHKIVFDCATGVMILWTVASLLAIALQCNLSMPWVIVGQNCSDTVSCALKQQNFR